MSLAEGELMSLLARGIIDSPCPVMITDRQGFIIYVNPRFTLSKKGCTNIHKPPLF